MIVYFHDSYYEVTNNNLNIISIVAFFVISLNAAS